MFEHDTKYVNKQIVNFTFLDECQTLFLIEVVNRNIFWQDVNLKKNTSWSKPEGFFSSFLSVEKFCFTFKPKQHENTFRFPSFGDLYLTRNPVKSATLFSYLF